MRAVVFGGTGFLGKAVVRQLRGAGHQVHSVARRPDGADAIADVSDASSLERLSLDAEVAINLAARVPTGPSTLGEHAPMFAANAVGAANVAQWACARGIRRVVQGSTLVVASRPWPAPLREDAPTAPTGPVAAYAASKLAGELVAGSIVREAKGSFVALRFSALYGIGMAWSGVLPLFIDRALSGKPLTAASGAHADFLHLEDAARAVVAACGSSLEGVVNAASGVETSIVELGRLVLGACGRSPDELTVTDGAVGRAQVDVDRLRELGAAATVPLAKGIAELVNARREEAQ